MEAVARQWATGKKVSSPILATVRNPYSPTRDLPLFLPNHRFLVLRNGYFSYRWTDIFEQTGIPCETIVVKGQPVDNSPQPQVRVSQSPHTGSAIAHTRLTLSV